MEFKERKRWLFFGLPFTFTKYTIKEDLITETRGFLSKEEDYCYMYKVQDVRLKKSFLERIIKIGTIICYTGDTTDKQLELKHIKHAEAIKDFLIEASEQARLKRRTLNTLNIGVDDLEGADPADMDI